MLPSKYYSRRKVDSFRLDCRKNEGEKKSEETKEKKIRKCMIFMIIDKGESIIEKSYCHSSLANLKITSNDRRRRIRERIHKTLIGLRSDQVAKRAAVCHARRPFGHVSPDGWTKLVFRISVRSVENSVEFRMIYVLYTVAYRARDTGGESGESRPQESTRCYHIGKGSHCNLRTVS